MTDDTAPLVSAQDHAWQAMGQGKLLLDDGWEMHNTREALYFTKTFDDAELAAYPPIWPDAYMPGVLVPGAWYVVDALNGYQEEFFASAAHILAGVSR